MHAQVFFATVFGFLVGVFTASIFSVDWHEAIFFAGLAFALFFLAWQGRSKKVAILGILFFAGALGVVRMSEARLVPDIALSSLLERKVVVEGFIFDERDTRENSVRLSLRADRLEVGGNTTSISSGVLVIAPLLTDVQYGDRIKATGTLRKPKSFETGEGRDFNYPAFLAKDGLQYELSFASVEKIGEGRKNPLKAGAIWIKQTYLYGLGMALPEPQAGLAGGITAGDKRSLGGELSEVFRTVGLTHIIVLSGYNIMIVMYGIGWVLNKFSIRGWTEASIGIAVACFFALMTGLAAASVRAAAMASIAFIGKALPERVYAAHSVLAFVATGMVVWNPYILAFDPGFQLSVIATWGMIAFSPYLASHLSFVTNRLALREIAATTIATQLTVFPLILYQNGVLSLVSLPANLFALIAVPWAMLASFITGVFGIFAGDLAPIFGFPAHVLLSYILFVAEWSARLPLATVSIGAFPAAFVLLSYAALFIFARSQTFSQPPPNSNS